MMADTQLSQRDATVICSVNAVSRHKGTLRDKQVLLFFFPRVQERRDMIDGAGSEQAGCHFLDS